MRKEHISKNLAETKKLALELAEEVARENSKKEATVICLSGELGAGKTTFTQGFLAGLGAEGPYTSPTFVIMKEYQLKSWLRTIYHFDAYRVATEDIKNLGWKEIIANPKNIVIIEWAERVESIIPFSAIWLKFEWLKENQRKITSDSNY